MGPFTQALAIALAAGLPAVIWAIYRSRKLGPKEEEELIARSAAQAVETMSTVLNAARAERIDLLDRLKAAEELAMRRGKEIADARLKAESCEREIVRLHAEVASLRAGAG